MVDIDKMPAGRELDALVAEKVMGWYPPKHLETEKCRIDQNLVHSTYDSYWLSPDRPLSDTSLKHLSYCPPCYSCDISAAWEVLEEMRKAGWTIICYAYPSPVDGMNFCVHMTKEGLPLFGGWEDSMELAICLAAKMAKERT